MVKNTFIFSLFILNTCFLFGQKNIHGQILSADNTPSEYISVSILVNDSLLQSVYTDSLGVYNLTINYPADYYIFKLSSWGVKLHEEVITNFVSSTLIKNITLCDVSSINLEEFTVTGYQNNIQLKNDRLIYSPDISLAKSSSAFELLKHTPLIKADDNEISLIYKSGAKIHVNNRPLRMPVNSLIEYLKTTPADNIKNIEVVTNPGSNQEASVTGGIINIILRKNIDDGYRGQVSILDEQGRVNRQIGSTSFRLHKNNFGLQGGLSVLNYPSKYKSKTEITNKNGENQVIFSETKDESKGINLNLNLEYSPNENQYLNLFTSIRYNEPNSITTSFTEFCNKSNINTDSTTVTLLNDKGNKIKNYFFNVTYSYLINNKGQTLDVCADYLDYFNSQNRYMQNYMLLKNNEYEELSNYRTFVPQEINSYSVKVDYTLPINKNTLNAGTFYSYNKNDNMYEWSGWYNSNFIPDASKGNQFIYKERILSGYISFSRQWSDKVYTYLGVRGEQTAIESELIQTKSEKTTDVYFQLYPSFSFSFQPNDLWRINYSFSEKNQRPAFWQLNPLRLYFNDYLYTTNNPSLKTIEYYTQNLTISLRNKYMLITEHTYRRNDIGQFLKPDRIENNVNYYGMFNYGDRSTLYVSLVSSLNFFKGFWKSNVSIGFQYDIFKMKNDDINKYYENENSLNGIFRMSNTFQLSEKKNIWAYINFRYYSPNVYLTQNITSYPVINVELRKIWPKWTVSMMANDIFQGENSITKMTSKQKFSPYAENTYIVYPDSRSVSLRVSFLFGNNSKTKSNRQAKMANDEIQSRVK